LPVVFLAPAAAPAAVPEVCGAAAVANVRVME